MTAANKIKIFSFFSFSIFLILFFYFSFFIGITILMVIFSFFYIVDYLHSFFLFDGTSSLWFAWKPLEYEEWKENSTSFGWFLAKDTVWLIPLIKYKTNKKVYYRLITGKDS